jgi:hypothetical protein
MLNVYGNINFSSTNNTSFLSCIASEFPNERIGVAIGSNNVRNGFLFNVEGNAYFSSNINIDNDIFVKGTVGNVSDIRIKKDLKKIDCPLDKIEKISGYVYERIDTGRFETGLIAQEVLKILPEVINKDKDDYYNISYGNMMGLLVEGVKELNERLKRLEEKDFRNC